MCQLFLPDWLRPVAEDDTLAMCKFCHSTMQAHLSSLIGHTKGKKHLANMKAMAPTHSIADVLRPRLPEPRHVTELKLAVFIAGNYFILLCSEYI